MERNVCQYIYLFCAEWNYCTVRAPYLGGKTGVILAVLNGEKNRSESAVLWVIGYDLSHLNPNFHASSAIWWRYRIHQNVIPSWNHQAGNLGCTFFQNYCGWNFVNWASNSVWVDLALIHAYLKKLAYGLVRNSIFDNFWNESTPRYSHKRRKSTPKTHFLE